MNGSSPTFFCTRAIMLTLNGLVYMFHVVYAQGYAHGSVYANSLSIFHTCSLGYIVSLSGKNRASTLPKIISLVDCIIV